MVVIIHVIIALSSIILTSLSYIQPSIQRLRVAYALVGLTLASGFYLVWVTPSHMIQACTSGLVYIGVVSVGIVAAKSKLARQKAQLLHSQVH
jgi:hypothetical protein